ncbi:MAG: FAD-dependent oxidoreductase [Dehalococcoidia bacterium]|nr:FAD-dependent oxidoreductase [Dehalococcoidia bacterium]
MKSLDVEKRRSRDANMQEVVCDVLVVGGGAAGCLAAIGARQNGAEVVLAEKGSSITRSGNLASGIDHYDVLRVYVNAYQPAMKLVGKERVGRRCASAMRCPRLPIAGLWGRK